MAGVIKPIYKGFATRLEAELEYTRAWCRGELQPVADNGDIEEDPTDDQMPVPPQFIINRAMATEPVSTGGVYVVFRGSVPGVYDSW